MLKQTRIQRPVAGKVDRGDLSTNWNWARGPSSERPLAGDRCTPGALAQLQEQGTPLPLSERGFFEPRLGHSFANVRVHAGPEANAMARRLNARAFTSGSLLGFASGCYQPYTRAGRRLLAHELTHVVQQSRRGIGERSFRLVQRDNGGARTYQLKSFRFRGDNSGVLKRVAQGKVTLSSRSRGEAVKIVKDALLDAGYPLPKHQSRRAKRSSTWTSSQADTTFDAEAARAVRMFQRVSRIRAAGVVDVTTLKEMDSQIGNTPHNYAAELKRVALQLTKNVRLAKLKGIRTFASTADDWYRDRKYWREQLNRPKGAEQKYEPLCANVGETVARDEITVDDTPKVGYTPA